MVEGKYGEKAKIGDDKEILRQITNGLAYLHGLRIVHRDIKPTNILISLFKDPRKKPRMKLADFGLSKALESKKEDFTNTSMTNPHGSSGWMAPELYLNERHDFKVDIFALGCVFAYTLSSSGKHPFGDNPDERSIRIKSKGSLQLSQKDLKIPYSQDQTAIELIQLTLEMEPTERPSAEEILQHNFFSVDEKEIIEIERVINE